MTISRPEREQLVDEIRGEYKHDYIDDDSFLNQFSPDIAKHVSVVINRMYESSGEKDQWDETKDKVGLIFGGLQSIYTSLWLQETGYGEKLALKMAQLVYIDDYGDPCLDDWTKELKRFISDRLYVLDNYLDNSIPDKYKKYAAILDLEYQLLIRKMSSIYSNQEIIEDLAFTIDDEIGHYYERLVSNHIPSQLDDIEDPYEYEQRVSDEFVSLGWESYSTVGSGDQGADVVAEKNGIKLVVQCKLYSSSIGNKAVQEVAAAKGFYHGDIGAVITNSDFTKSAKQLAESLGVYLLHHSQIQELDGLLFNYEDEIDEIDEIDEFDEEY